MAYVGIDLAWSSKNRTGLAVVDEAGALTASGIARTDEDIDSWLGQHAPQPLVVAVDAPLIVPNATGMRVPEREIGRAFGRYGASAHTANRSKPWFNPPRAESLASRHGWDVDPATAVGAGRAVCLEVYPHPALVGLFGLPQRILYKKGADRQTGFRQLTHLLESVTALRLSESTRWSHLSALVEQPGPGDLTRIEDEIDAILCAHLAWLWHHEPDTLAVYGNVTDGYIVAPPAPHHASDLRTSPAAKGPGTGVNVFVEGRPTGYGGGRNETQWKSDVRTSIPGPPLAAGPVELEVEFVLRADQVARLDPDLDNLLKSTIDALEGALGPRPGYPFQADDVRITRIIASKRVGRDGERAGAEIRLKRTRR